MDDITEMQRLMFEWLRQCEKQGLEPVLLLAISPYEYPGDEQIPAHMRSTIFAIPELPVDSLPAVLEGAAAMIRSGASSVYVRPLP
jgi:hypothetical protein